VLHENFIMSLMPLHLGMRQYWRDFDALEAWSRSLPHGEWWRDFLRRTIRTSATCPWTDVLSPNEGQARR
jgi:hypothetical protein